MLHQVSYWTGVAAIAVSAILLCRILALRLHRVYVFITLACVLDLLFAGVALSLGEGSPANNRIFDYSRFVYAFVYPLVAWDVFEEMKEQVGKLRRLAMGRLVSSLFFAIIFGLLMAAFTDGNDVDGQSVVLTMLALVLWAGATTASLAFLYTIYRFLHKQPIVRPNNTSVWVYYYGLSFMIEVLYCFLLLVLPLTKSNAVRDTVSILLDAFGIILTSWCILKLRAVASDLPSASEKARL